MGPGDELDPGHPGHPLVGDEQVDRPALEDGEGLLAGAGAQRLVPLLRRKRLPQDAQHLGLVVDEEDRGGHRAGPWNAMDPS